MSRLKNTALCSLLFFFAACASPSAMIDQTSDCGPGQDLEIRAALGDSRSGEFLGQNIFLVEVANNSHEDVTVKRVRVEPRELRQSSINSRRAPLNGAAKDFNQTIAEGTEHVFELPTTASAMLSPDMQDAVVSEELELHVTVELTSGESYRCAFAVTRR